jgi:hypothetical protein
MEQKLEFTFVGHQTWLISSESEAILLDPVLGPGFGNSEFIEFEVYPPRRVEVDQIPALSAVFLSHEHLDHFHIASLALLERSIPVYVATTLPECVSQTIEALGFEVRRVGFCEPIRFRSIEVTLHAASRETIFWEKRVAQLYVHHLQLDRSCFIAVDALVAESFRSELERRAVTPPSLVVVSNNSMISAPGAVEGNPFKRATRDLYGPRPGVALVQELILQPIEIFGREIEIAICGNGHLDHTRDAGPFLLSDHHELARCINDLSLSPRVHGPYPGESLALGADGVIRGTVPWVTLDHERHAAYKDQLKGFLRAPRSAALKSVLPTASGEAEVRRDIACVQQFLPEFARFIMASDTGTQLLGLSRLDWPELSERRILLRLLVGDGRAVQFAVDVRSTRFELDRTAASDIFQMFPCGIELFLRDLAGVLRGEIQIWDISGRATRSWQLGPPASGLEALLLCILGEQVRPELHVELFARAVQRTRRAKARSGDGADTASTAHA